MPYDDPDPEDPNLLVGVSLPGSPETTRAMAEAFADEFAALGLDREAILALFRTPEYAAAHGAWRRLGDAEIGRMVDESLGVWGRRRVTVTDQPIAEDEADPASLIRRGGLLKMQR